MIVLPTAINCYDQAMKLTGNIIIPEAKLTHYLLVPQAQDVDTPRPKGAGILGSPSPLTLESLRSLKQRWFSPQALTFPVPLGSCIAAKFV